MKKEYEREKERERGWRKIEMDRQRGGGGKVGIEKTDREIKKRG